MKQLNTAQKTGIVLAILIFCSALAGFWFVSRKPDFSGGPSALQLKGIGRPFTLTDHNGGEITEQALAGHPAAVFFGFTHCPEVCPTTLYELSVWLDELCADGEKIKSLFVTVDPARDTPEIMKSYITAFTDRITGVTGDPEQISALAKSWYIYWKKVPLDDGGYTMDHTASIMLVDAQGNLRSTIAYGENAETAKAKLRNLVKG